MLSRNIERIIKKGQVTLATFYRHFPSQVDLVVAYLHGAHDHICARATEQAEPLPGRNLVRVVGDDVTSRILQAAFRGCAFLNAVLGVRRPAEPCPPGRRRAPPVQFLRQAFEDAGQQLPANAARHLVTLRDGARSAGYLDTPSTAICTFARGVDRLLRTPYLVSPR